MNKSKQLKERGNDAFKAKKFHEAIDFFTKAIEIEEASPSKDAELLAVLQSNVAQVYLELKNYDEAIMFASLSILNDPLFVKSILRRAIAQFELGRHIESTVDLRSVLKSDPKHPKAIQLMRKIMGYELNSESMRSAYVRHHLRRSIIELIHASNSSIYDKFRFTRAMLRVTFLSSLMAPATNYFWSNGHLEFEENTILGYHLRSWFVGFYVRNGIACKTTGIQFKVRSVEAILAVVQPKNVTLFIDCLTPSIEQLRAIYKFDAVCYEPVYHELFTKNVDQRFLNDLKRVSKHLTMIPCFDELMSLPSSNFANMDTLIFVRHGISLDFLNLWEERKWSIEKLILHERPDLLNAEFFDPLSASVRGKVKSLCYTFVYPYPESISSMRTAYQDLDILKRAFPSISEFLGTFIFIIDGAYLCSYFFRSGLKGHIRWLVTTFDAEKIRFGDRPKVVTWVTLKFYQSEQVDLGIEACKRIVKECRQEFPQIESITLSQSEDGFDWVPMVWSHAVIDIKANGINFQVAMKRGHE